VILALLGILVPLVLPEQRVILALLGILVPLVLPEVLALQVPLVQ
jgi:hypothetical protein